MQLTRRGPYGHCRNKYQVMALLTGLLFCHTYAQAAENGNPNDGTHGLLHVRGALLASACGLAMESVNQEIWLGETSTAMLRKLGDEGTSVPVELRLTGCLPIQASSVDRRTGNRVWSQSEPAVSVSFYAPVDPDMPSSILANGVSGLAIRVSDASGNKMRLNERNAPILISPGSNTLRYALTPVRTSASLLPGAWRAVINFGVNYD